MQKYRIDKKLIIQTEGDISSIFNPESSYLFTLNSTATYILKKIEQNKHSNQIASSMSKQYNISKAEAEQSVNECIHYLISEKIIL